MSMLAAAGACLRPSLWSQVSPSAPANPEPSLPPKVIPTEFVNLRRNVGLFSGKGGTIGWLSSPAGLLAVDTQFPEAAELFLAGLPGRDKRRLSATLNTHHHADHTSGNPVFKPVSEMIVAQRKVPFYQLRWAERNHALGKQVFADTLFEKDWKTEIGDEVVSARFLGAAHTGADSIVLFEKANVVHMGDLVFNRLYPVIDRVGGGSVVNWVKVLETAIKDYPADAIYIFGHGNPKFGVSGTRNDLALMRDYLTALLAYVEKRIAEGVKREDLVKLDNLPGFPDLHLPPGKANRLPLNLGLAYDELTKAPAE
jgi:glyoxylase-like metal-dependent hydrolase (beta-lactamase superfamily II)